MSLPSQIVDIPVLPWGKSELHEMDAMNRASVIAGIAFALESTGQSGIALALELTGQSGAAPRD